VAKTTERLFHRIIDRCLPAGTIGHDACHAKDQEEIDRLKSLLREVLDCGVQAGPSTTTRLMVVPLDLLMRLLAAALERRDDERL